MYISNEVNWLKYLEGKSVVIFGALYGTIHRVKTY